MANAQGFMPPETTPPCSQKKLHIAGILTTVYGLQELPSSCTTISCLWLHHPRLATQEMMAPVAARFISEWNKTLENSFTGIKRGLIAVSYDQRNHGTRLVDNLSNEAWNAGNPRHAQDMFSIYHGTAVDTSLLIDHLTSYVFSAANDTPVEQHLVMGISLGGHSAWQLIFDDPRVTAAVVRYLYNIPALYYSKVVSNVRELKIVIGCPDYERVMTDRARLSKLATYTTNNGSSFIGSLDFPSALIQTLHKRDPKGILFPNTEITTSPTPEQQTQLRKTLDKTIKGKKLLALFGKDDKLVPYHCSKPFLDFLKSATGSGGWYADGDVYVEDIVYEGIGHAYSEGMARDAQSFICDVLAGADMPGKNGPRL